MDKRTFKPRRESKGMLFPWHKDDEILRELFRHLSKEAVDHVGEALNEVMMKWENRRPSP